MDEVDDAEIQAAEAATADHNHLHARPHDGSLRQHLAAAHSMTVPEDLSASTQEGLHDRLHGQTDAAAR